MAAEQLSIIVLFLFLPLAKQDSINGARRDVLQAVGSIVDFYDLDYQNLNVDGLFGLRVIEGHLEGILTQYENDELNHISVDMIDDIKRMKEKATRCSELAVSHVKKDGIEYYKQMSYVVNAPWNIFDHQHRKINFTLEWPPKVYANAKKSVKLDEEVSDRCMSELIGSHKSHGKSCDISKQCAYTMTVPGLLGYGITHQVLWTMLAEKAGCLEKLKVRLRAIGNGDLTALRQALCSNNYIQLRETINKMPDGILLPSVQDLFLEQLFVCPSLGYYEFLDLDFLPQVLSWQAKNGCYGKLKKTFHHVKLDKDITGKFKDEYDETTDGLGEDMNEGKLKQKLNDKLEARVDEVRELKKRYKAEVDQLKRQNVDDAYSVWEMPNNTGRRLLVEKSMSDGCLAHKTAVASGALMMYLRYLFAEDAYLLFSSKRRLRSAEPPLSNKASKMQKLGLEPMEALTKHPKLGISQHDLGLGALKHTGGGDNVNALQNIEKFQHAFKQFKNESSANLNKHHQVVAPRFDKDERFKETYDNNHLALNNNVEPSKDDQNYDYKYDDDNNNNNDEDDDDYDDDDEDDDDDYDDDEAEIKDDEFHAYRDKPGGKINRNMNNYYNGIERGDIRGHGMNNIGPDDDNDDDYNADDGYDDGYDDNDQENVHPHINARNIGHGKSRDYDKEVYEDGNNIDKDDKGVKDVKDYDDDEEGDDYEYDDENDEMEKRRQEELKNEFILAKTSDDKKVVDVREKVEPDSSVVTEQQSMLSKTPFIILVLSLICVIILYRLIKRRRIRLKIGHKYFHV